MSKVGLTQAVPDPTFGQTPQPPAGDVGLIGAVGAAAVSQDAADLRLVIEEDQAAGTYVYKTIDRRTGEVVKQLPREEVLRMREDRTYRRGAVIDAKA